MEMGDFLLFFFMFTIYMVVGYIIRLFRILTCFTCCDFEDRCVEYTVVLLTA
ncbi:hypothetical protein BDC45DRAFT_500355 [Circinella umbellata]|nr:hypothetical protein BDC45DRAFT_500355 [Circinella umbellata]